jgi:chromosome segregation ATPase
MEWDERDAGIAKLEHDIFILEKEIDGTKGVINRMRDNLAGLGLRLVYLKREIIEMRRKFPDLGDAETDPERIEAKRTLSFLRQEREEIKEEKRRLKTTLYDVEDDPRSFDEETKLRDLKGWLHNEWECRRRKVGAWTE